MLNLVDYFCQNLLILCKMSGFPQDLLYGRLEDKKIGGYAVIGWQCPLKETCHCEEVQRPWQSHNSEILPIIKPHPSPLFPPLPQYLLNFKIFEQEFSKEREYNSPKLIYRQKQSPLTLALSRRGRGNDIKALFRAKVNSRGRGDNTNSPKRTYSPIDLLTYSLKKKHAAFTLAEVLITLGIIGVVAALTIPALVSNYKKQVVETSLKKYYSVLNQAIQRSEAEYGPAVNWEWESTVDTQKTEAFFDKYFAPYLAIVDKKSANADTEKLYYKIYAADGDGPLWDFNNSNNMHWRQLSDGGAVFLSLLQSGGSILGTCNFILPTGSKASHLIEGKDVFAFSINISSDKTAVSMFPKTYRNWDCTYIQNNLDTFIDRCKSVNYTGEGIYPSQYCAALIYCNGWKIPDYYPVKI